MSSGSAGGTGGGDWTEWSQYVRLGLNDLKEKIDKLSEKYDKLVIEFTIMKMKVALWGGIGAAIATGAFHILSMLIKIK